MTLPTTPDVLRFPAAKPSPRALPLLPFIARFVRNPLRSLPRSVYQEDIVTYGGDRPMIAWVTSPDLIETILLKDAEKFPKTRLERRVLKPVVGDGILTAEGESWRWQRKLASPLFRHSEILGYLPAIVETAEECVAGWKARGDRFTADVELAMTEATFAVITRTILAGLDEREAKAIARAGRTYLEPVTWELASALLLLPEWVWHPGKSRMRRSAVEIRSNVLRLVEARRQRGGEDSDLLARMIAAEDTRAGAPMRDEQIVDNLATFLLAGHETTAKALTWTLYALARQPALQQRVRDEVNEVLGDAPVATDSLNRLALTTRVLKESMRLFPPVPVMTRVTAETVDLGGKRLPKPTLVVIPVYAVHRHERLWDDPERFDPDRFLPEREKKIPRTQFMPFGYGQRFCIGSAFALAEATTILATLLRRVRFEWDGRHEPEPLSRVTLRPKGGMPLIVRTV